MCITLRRPITFAPLCISILLLLFVWASPAHAVGLYQISIQADPPRVNYTAEGPNRVTLRITLSTVTGQPAPNLTQVRITTNLGVFTNTQSSTDLANTQNGQVTVQLENTQGAGRATIEVYVGTDYQLLYVDFMGPSEVAGKGKVKRLRYVLKSKQCYFSADKQLFDLPDDAHFIAPTFTVDAPSLQYAVKTNVLTAQSNALRDVLVTAGKHTFTAKLLRIDLKSNTGSLVEMGPDITYKSFKLATMDPVVDELAQKASFARQDPQPTRSWIISQEVTVYPNEQLQFRHVGFYFDGLEHCFLRVPVYVQDLRTSSGNTILNTAISMSSDAAFSIDCPFYYSADDRQVGALHLRDVGNGISGGAEGVQAGLEEDYTLDDGGKGTLDLNDLARQTRGLTWSHSEDIDATHLNLNAAYDRYASDMPYSTSLSLSANRTIDKIGMSFSTNVSAFSGNDDMYSEIAANLPEKMLGKSKYGLYFAPYIGFRDDVTAATVDSEASNTSAFYQGLRSSLAIPTAKLYGGVLSPSVSDDLSHNPGGLIDNSFSAGMYYQHKLIKPFSSTLGYTFGLTSQTHATTPLVPSQQLSLDLNGNARSWSLSASTSYSLADQSMYSSLGLLYHIPWDCTHKGERRWYFQYGLSASSGASLPFTYDHIFTLGRVVGHSYSLLLHYSPSADNVISGFGFGTGQQLAFEVVRQGW
jgi:hypothetical protein